MSSDRLDLAEARRRIRAGSFDTAALRAWLSTTYEDADRFRDELLAYCFEKRRGMLKSRRPGGYDLYHDIVLAHADRRRPALVWKDAGGVTSLSFEQVHERASKIAATWAARGATPGASVCIVQARGGEWLMAILAALQLGLVVSLVSSAGPALLRRRLAELAPEYVVLPEAIARTLGPLPGEVLSTSPAPLSRPLPGSHTYGEEDPAFRLLSPFADCMAEVPAGLAHHSVLRDGELVFGLEPSDAVAAPGWDALQTQPLLFLTTLAAGAAWVELDDNDLDAEPDIVARHGISLLGVGATTREHFLRADVDPPKRAWFGNLTDALDFDAWSALAERMSGNKVPGFGIVTNAACAGTLLFGLPAKSFSLNVWPVPGLALELEEIGARGPLVAHGDAGRASPSLPDSVRPAVPNVILSRRDEAWVLAGSLDLGPHSHAYPTDTVVQVVKVSRPDVRHADVVLTKGRWPNEAKATLLLFLAVGLDGARPANLDLRAIRKLIAEQVGSRWVPDRIEAYPLEPRSIAGEIDREHCRSQYLSGALSSKARTEIFVQLSRLRHIFAARKQTD